MFRKIRSNRDPANTLWSELKREFSPYFRRAGQSLKRFAAVHPKLIFSVMVAAIMLSAAFSFTLFRQRPAPKTAAPAGITAPLTGGIDRIIQTGDAIRQMLALKKRIDSLSEKKQLTAADSIDLESTLDSFRQFSSKLDPAKPAKR